MDVAHIAAFHKPTDVRIFQKECRSLAAAGHRVAFVVPEAEDGVTRDGVRFVAVPPCKSKNHAVWLARSLWRVWRTARRQKADVYHFHEPDMIPVALLIKWSGGRVVYDAHEDVPRQIRTRCRGLGLPWLATVASTVYAGMEHVAMLQFDAFIAATPAISRRFPPDRTVTVCNFPLPDDFDRVETPPYASRGPRVVYAGGITRLRGLLEMVRAMSLVPDRLDARLELVGEFVKPSLRADAEATPGWDRIEARGWVDRRGVAEAFGRARLGLVLFHPEPNHIEAQPNKLFEYMAAGLPVVASDFPLWRQIVEGSGCGLLVDPLDPAAIAEAVAYLLDHPEEAEAMGIRGREAVRSRYHWGTQERELLALYDRLSAGAVVAAAGAG